MWHPPPHHPPWPGLNQPSWGTMEHPSHPPHLPGPQTAPAAEAAQQASAGTWPTRGDRSLIPTHRQEGETENGRSACWCPGQRRLGCDCAGLRQLVLTHEGLVDPPRPWAPPQTSGLLQISSNPPGLFPVTLHWTSAVWLWEGGKNRADVVLPSRTSCSVGNGKALYQDRQAEQGELGSRQRGKR